MIFKTSTVPYGWDDTTKLHIILNTLPSKVREQVLTRNIRTIAELKSFCQLLYPTSLQTQTKKKFDSNEYTRRIHMFETNTDNKESEEEEEDDVDDAQIAEMIKTFKRFDKKFSRNTHSNGNFSTKNETSSKSEKKPNKSEFQPEIKTVENEFEGHCWQCKEYGHRFRDCSQLRAYTFCFNWMI